MGVGITLGKCEHTIQVDLSLCLRYGVFDKIDLGLKIAGFPDLGYGVFVDARYNLLEQPLLIAADLGFMTFSDLYAPDDELKAYGFHPTVFFGNDQIYGGIGWN